MTASPSKPDLAPSGPDSGPDGLRFARVTPANLEAAASALVRGSTGGDPRAGRRFLQSARMHDIDLTHFWAAFPPGGPTDVRHACLVVPGAGATGMVFVSRLERPEDCEAIMRLLHRTLTGLSGVRLAQALLSPEEASLRPAMVGAGFLPIADLVYMRRDWRPPAWRPIRADDREAWPVGVSVVSFPDGSDDDLALALDASYVDTRDCPALHGLRRTEDVIASHKGAGRFDPTLWWLVYRDGAPAGALLLNQCPEQDHTELVYLGLAPALRGLGVGRRLLRMGIGALERRAHRALTCAVDARNAPAQSLYESEGFAPIAMRAAYVCPLVDNM